MLNKVSSSPWNPFLLVSTGRVPHSFLPVGLEAPPWTGPLLITLVTRKNNKILRFCQTKITYF